MTEAAASPFSDEDVGRAAALLDAFKARNWRVATAESCTGGLVAALLTEVAGSSAVVDCGFVTYSNEAKSAMLGVDPALIERHGAVSAETAAAMAAGALARSRADVAIAVTGIAGPGGGSPTKPVGLVHFGLARRGADPVLRACRFEDGGRPAIRLAALREALSLLEMVAGSNG